MKRSIWIMLLLTVLTSVTLLGQNPLAVDHLYVVALNGKPVVIDGELDDWSDAEFIYISGDLTPLYNTLLEFGSDMGDPVESPDDFSAHIAMKMDDDNLYFLVHVSDEGGVLNHGQLTRETANLLGSFDAFTPYLGLYDIGYEPYSPHTELVDIVIPNDTVILQSGRTYRIRPGYDKEMGSATYNPLSSTRGADYQFGIHAQEYNTLLSNGAYYATGDEVINYNWGYVDTLISNTEVAIKVWDNEDGYTIEWKVPFTSLAGRIAKESKPQSVIDWPLYTPRNGDILPFDFDVLDNDRNTDIADWSNNFLRFSPYQEYPGTRGWRACWRDSYRWGGRAIVKDVSGGREAQGFVHALLVPNGAGITIDGVLDSTEWSMCQFTGRSLDSPYGYADQISNSDLSAYVGIKMDDENLYFALQIRDDQPITQGQIDPDKLNEMYMLDYFSPYLGLYNIGDLPRSPHSQIVNIIQPDNPTEVLQAGRAYRIRPGYDDDSLHQTLGADHQIGLNLQEYDDILANGAYYATGANVMNYNWGYADTTIQNTEVATLVWDDETGFTTEWRIPWSSFSGKISKPSKPQASIEWPYYRPHSGDILPYEWEMGDQDMIGGDTHWLGASLASNCWMIPANFTCRVRIIDPLGNKPLAFDETNTATLVNPKKNQLSFHYPNPFNATTQILFLLPQADRVTLTIHNIMGQNIQTLINNQFYPQGEYMIRWDASEYPTGIYFYRLETTGGAETQKMMLVK